jgi:exonuclease VII small subunit
MTKKPSEYDFKKAFNELEMINEWFSGEQGSDLSLAIEKYRRGAEIVKEIRVHLSDVENEFKEIKRGLEQD